MIMIVNLKSALLKQFTHHNHYTTYLHYLPQLLFINDMFFKGRRRRPRRRGQLCLTCMCSALGRASPSCQAYAISSVTPVSTASASASSDRVRSMRGAA